MIFARICLPLARRLLVAVGLALIAALPARAQQTTAGAGNVPASGLEGTSGMPLVPVDPGFAALRYMIDNDPDAALTRIQVLLAEMQKDDTSDARVIFDLYRVAADLLIEGGNAAQAAQIKAQLADFAVRFRDGVGLDPIPLYAEAAALLEDTGQLEAAHETLLALIAEQRAGALSDKEIAGARADLARVSATLGQPVPELAPRPAGQGMRMIDVYYATDRARSDERRPQTFYGGGRGLLELGVASVSVPEAPLPGVAAAGQEPPAGHAVLRGIAPLAPAAFHDRLRQALAARPEPDLLVYVHGYNVPFEQAARQAAGIARNMRFDGVPVLYSWPSGGSAVDYIGDTAAVRLSGRRLARFLQDLRQQSGARRIHLVAHGMGNRALTDALELMAVRQDQGPVFGQVIFAAPDVDAGLFVEVLPTIRLLAERLTLYASDRERTLRVARALYGDALRAGEGGEIVLTDPLLDSVDASALGGDLLTSGDVYSAGAAAGGRTMLADMAALFWRNADPAARCGLFPQGAGAGTVWVYDGSAGDEDICTDPVLPGVLAALRRAQIDNVAGAQAELRRLITDPALRARLEPVVLKLMGK